MSLTPSPHPRIIVSSHTQSARHYTSALSIWLSVDPMSDKYPSTSPYTYCGNNPVRLVDPNGRTWESPEDQEYANSLIAKAQEMQANYEKGSEGYNKLQEGIDGLTYMGEVEDFTFTFSEAKNIDHLTSGEKAEGNVTRDDNGVFHINYLTSFNNPEVKKGSAWHESVHLTRFLKQNVRYLIWEMERNGQVLSTPFKLPEYGYGFHNRTLGTTYGCEEERHAYSSQYFFHLKACPYTDCFL